MTSPEHTLEIKDLDHFVGLLSRWHTTKVKTIKHMMTVPDTTEVILEEGTPVQMTGEFRKGFVLGLTIALAELGELPFVAELEDATTAVKH